jgi:hypothetical protein
MGIDDVTLVTIETHHHELAGLALEECLKRLPFKHVCTFSDRPILDGARHVPISVITSLYDYCDLLLKSMWPFINTSHMLFVQWDAMIQNADYWDAAYLNYDYIGAVWPWHAAGSDVGNGGFSLRSKKLLHALRDSLIQLDPDTPDGLAEDVCIGRTYRYHLENVHGINYAPADVAAKFSFEHGDYAGSFGIHAIWNVFQFMPDEVVNSYVEKLPAAVFEKADTMYRALASLANRGRLDLIEYTTETLRHKHTCSRVKDLIQQSEVPHKNFIIERLACQQ